MNNKRLCSKLQDKMSAELDKYRDWLVQQPPEEILKHTYEFTSKADIVLLLDSAELSSKQLTALLWSSTPLDDAYRVFRNVDDTIGTVRACLEDRADTVLKLQQEIQRRKQREKQRNTPQKKSVMERLQEKTAEPSQPRHTPAKGADAR